MVFAVGANRCTLRILKGMWTELVGLFVDHEFLATPIGTRTIDSDGLRLLQLIDPVVGGARLVVGQSAILIADVIRRRRHIP